MCSSDLLSLIDHGHVSGTDLDLLGGYCWMDMYIYACFVWPAVCMDVCTYMARRWMFIHESLHVVAFCCLAPAWCMDVCRNVDSFPFR